MIVEPSTCSPEPVDLRAIEQLVQTVYQSISGPAGAPRDWDRHAQCFAPGAKCYIVHSGEGLAESVEVLSIEEYRRSREAFFSTQAFYEHEVLREASIRGNIAHIFSTYQAYDAPGGNMVASGTNSIELIRGGGRWWIAAIVWEAHQASRQLRSNYVELD